jgi:hypothetical protein
MSWNWLTVAKDITESLFYIITGGAVVVGLRGWKKELKGKGKYEAAKNVIAGAYRVRDAINETRSPLMVSGEWEGRQRDQSEPENEKGVHDSYYAYANRFKRVIDALSQWYPAVVEAEALFGEEARKKIEAVNSSARNLRAAIDIHHRNVFQAATSRLIREESASTAKFHRQNDNIIYGVHPGMGKPDEDKSYLDDGGFQKGLDSAVNGIREYFSKYIK